MSSKISKNRSGFLAAPARPGPGDGRGYSRFVRGLRLMLPVLAVGAIGLVMAWPRVEDTLGGAMQVKTIEQPVVGRNELISPRFESEDSKNRPFTITADRAVQSRSDADVVILEKPQADMTLKDGAWISLGAARGAYRQKEEKLFLEENVRLFHDEGYEVTTAKLLIDLKAQRAWSDQPVQGQGPAGTLAAAGLQAAGAEGKLVFIGPARLVLNKAVRGL